MSETRCLLIVTTRASVDVDEYDSFADAEADFERLKARDDLTDVHLMHWRPNRNRPGGFWACPASTVFERRNAEFREDRG